MSSTRLVSAEMAFLSTSHVHLPTSRLFADSFAGSRLQICRHRPKQSHVQPVRMGLLDAFKNVMNPSTSKTSAQSTSEAGSSAVAPVADSDLPTIYWERVSKINALESEIEPLSDEQIASEFESLRTSVRSGDASIEDVNLVHRVFALVREATFRVLSLRHYDVQLVGGLVLNEGSIAEMATGEGKTIVAVLAAALNALTDKGVFVVTVNDYLARRDAELIGQVLRYCGFSVGLIQGGMEPSERRKAYNCDVTYVTNSELGFDYLRDNLAMSVDEVVLERPLGFCILDEVDSILIDEARTPLIISSRVSSEATAQKYGIAKRAADALVRDTHYTVDEKEQAVILTEQGYIDLEQALKVSNLFDARNPWASFITNAIKAKELFKLDVNYIVNETEQQVEIVDEYTGRVMPGRRWSDGLHQAVEAKEGIKVDSEASTSAKISYQSFFRLFNKVAGMTGTAATEADELQDIYGLPVVRIPTALPMGRKVYPDVVFKNANGKYRGVMREIANVAPTGRPILIGTTSVEASESLSNLLTEVEVWHDVLNAKPESALRESEIIAQAGRKYSITIATNMAGRGTDILLGGNADFFARALARRSLASLEPELFKTLTDPEQPVLITDEDLPIDISPEAMTALDEAAAALRSSTEQTQSSHDVQTLVGIDEAVGLAAESSPLSPSDEALKQLREAMATIKAELVDVVAEEREEVLDLGGLYVIGTERAESRRVDNQLRGRAGRQGDPGSSRFFLALDDTLFRVFGGDKVKGVLESFRVDEETPIENTLVNQTLDTAQCNVEEYFRGIRESVFQYDEILATQRAAFYTERRRILEANPGQLLSRFRDECARTADDVVDGNVKAGNIKIAERLSQFFNGITEVDAEHLDEAVDVRAIVLKQVDEVLDKTNKRLDDLRLGFGIEVLRFLWLTQMDKMWAQHMKTMDYVKEMVGLRVYEGEQPLDVYQREGFSLFNELLANIRRNNVFSYFQYKAPQTSQSPK